MSKTTTETTKQTETIDGQKTFFPLDDGAYIRYSDGTGTYVDKKGKLQHSPRGFSLKLPALAHPVGISPTIITKLYRAIKTDDDLRFLIQEEQAYRRNQDEAGLE
ncbi:MAG: hypothetical protein ABFC24_12765 [Methanoregulaceae archaeon]